MYKKTNIDSHFQTNLSVHFLSSCLLHTCIFRKYLRASLETYFLIIQYKTLYCGQYNFL